MNWRISFTLIIIAAIACLGNGCQAPYRLRRQQIPQTPLFIAMPVNNHVAESVGPLIYDAITKHFQRCGYSLVSATHQGYSLRTTINALTTTQRFISQDIVLLDKLTELSITCSLHNFRNELVKEKTFIFETIVPKSKAPLQQASYTDFHMQQMLARNIDTIEQTFKPYL